MLQAHFLGTHYPNATADYETIQFECKHECCGQANKWVLNSDNDDENIQHGD